VGSSWSPRYGPWPASTCRWDARVAGCPIAGRLLLSGAGFDAAHSYPLLSLASGSVTHEGYASQREGRAFGGG
jgi:hypothetical protein